MCRRYRVKGTFSLQNFIEIVDIVYILYSIYIVVVVRDCEIGDCRIRDERIGDAYMCQRYRGKATFSLQNLFYFVFCV